MKVGDKVRRINNSNKYDNGVTFEVGEIGTVIAVDDTTNPQFASVEKENGEITLANSVDNLEVIAEESPAESPKIKDSGNRREFATGAVRDIQEGKGRCDLLPLDIVADIAWYVNGWNSNLLRLISKYQEEGDPVSLLDALNQFESSTWGNFETMLLEVSKHFEEGCEKYGEDNWKKGIPTKCYINSAVRHLIKYVRGDKDEPHDRAFAWNILCCIWTCVHKPELNSYAKL